MGNDYVSPILLTVNTIYSVATLDNIFSIILLVFQFIYLMIILGLKLYNALKDKKLSKDELEDIKDTTEDIKDLIDDIKGDKKDGEQ